MGVGGLNVLFDAATAVWVARMKEGARKVHGQMKNSA